MTQIGSFHVVTFEGYPIGGAWIFREKAELAQYLIEDRAQQTMATFEALVALHGEERVEMQRAMEERD